MNISMSKNTEAIDIKKFSSSFIQWTTPTYAQILLLN